MKIMVINPNTSESMTEHIRHELERIKRPDTELTVVCAKRGPETIESAYDEALAIPPTLDLVRKANRERFDAILIACFSDPGLEAAKEISEIPVIGIEESALHMAAMLGAKFSILTPRKERIPSRKAHVHIVAWTISWSLFEASTSQWQKPMQILRRQRREFLKWPRKQPMKMVQR